MTNVAWSVITQGQIDLLSHYTENHENITLTNKSRKLINAFKHDNLFYADMCTLQLFHTQNIVDLLVLVSDNVPNRSNLAFTHESWKLGEGRGNNQDIWYTRLRIVQYNNYYVPIIYCIWEIYQPLMPKL